MIYRYQLDSLNEDELSLLFHLFADITGASEDNIYRLGILRVNDVVCNKILNTKALLKEEFSMIPESIVSKLKNRNIPQ